MFNDFINQENTEFSDLSQLVLSASFSGTSTSESPKSKYGKRRSFTIACKKSAIELIDKTGDVKKVSLFKTSNVALVKGVYNYPLMVN